MNNSKIKNKKAPIKPEKKQKNHEVPILIFIVAFLIIDFLPYFNTLDVLAPQYAYLSALNIIVALYIYFNAELISENLISTLRKSIILKGYLAFIIICGISVFFAKNVSLSIVSIMQLLTGVFIFLNFYILLYNRLHLIYKISLLVGINILVVGLMQIKDLFASQPIIDGLSNFKGNTGNVNFFAASINAKIPFIILGIMHFGSFKKWFLSLALAVGISCVFLSGSRGAYLGLGAGIILFILFYFKEQSGNKLNLLKLIYVLIPIILAFVFTNQVFRHSSNNSRYLSVINRLEQINVGEKKDGAISYRLTTWRNGFKMIKKSPIIGFGVGNWLVESSAYEGELTDNVSFSGHAHNDFIEIAAESGIFGSLTFIFIILSVLIINIKTIFSDKTYHTKLIAILVLMLLMSYGADAMFSFPLYRPPMLICLSFILLLTIINSAKIETSTIDAEHKNITLAILICSLVPIYFTYSTLKAYQFEKKLKDDFVKPLTERQLSADDIINNIPKYPNICIMSAEPYVRYAGIYSFQKKDYQNAEKYFKLSEAVTPYMQVENWFRHLMLKEAGNIDSAYKLVKKSFYLRPRNEAFYTDMIGMANLKKDTLEMLKVHNLFSKYRTSPKNWINTSNGLYNSGYSNKKLIEFIDGGLKKYPNDSTLLERKQFFINHKTASQTVIAERFVSQLRFDKALDIYKKVYKENPNDKTALMNIGICYFKLNQYQTAISWFKIAFDVNAINTGLTEYYLGISYLNIKDKTNGCRYLNLAKAKNYPGIDTLLQQYCQ